MEERPLECSRCEKEADVTYSEIVGKMVTTVRMCRDCPVLKQKLQGHEATERICCEHCKTSLESIITGNPLGCKECYVVFQDILCEQLLEMDLLSPRLKSNHSTLHTGQSPAPATINTQTKRLSTLNQALSEALTSENFEQAAWIRDQISTLKEKTYDA